MAEYTAIVEAGNALVELLRAHLTPEPLANRETIALSSPYESAAHQLTVHLYHMEEENRSMTGGYETIGQNLQRRSPVQMLLRYLITAHSQAPVPLREADQHRIIGAAIQTVRDYPVIPAQYLSGSLAEERAQLHILMERVPMEQMLKIWNQTTKDYKLSFVVLMTGVNIASKRERTISRVTDLTIQTRPISGDRA